MANLLLGCVVYLFLHRIHLVSFHACVDEERSGHAGGERFKTINKVEK